MGKFRIGKIHEKLVLNAIEGVKYLEAKIHRICLTGDYGYESLADILGGLYDDTGHSRNPKYGKKYVKQYRRFYLIIYVNPKLNFMPKCLIEIHPRENMSPPEYKQILAELDNNLPEMKLSKVEYAIDQYCSTPEECERLYSIEELNLFIPYKRQDMMKINQDLKAFGDKDRINRLRHITDNDKIYERGPDNKKVNEGWPFKTLNRVRLEHTSSRDELKRHRLNILTDLIEDPKLSTIIGERWKFRQFKYKTFPKPWEYKIRGLHEGCFQSEYQQKKKTVKNICQNTTDIPQFDDLKKRIKNEANRFDAIWMGL